MTVPPDTRTPERRRAPRDRTRDPAAHRVLSAALGATRERVHGLRAALGVVVLAGAALAAGGAGLFAAVAHSVRGGRTQAFDDAVLRWVGAHRIPWLEAAMLELTFLGTATVVVGIAAVAALFLALTRQRTAAALLLWSTLGAIALNTALKAFFDRPRPRLFDWGTHAATTSFPSGHAMSAAAIYGTVAFLAARLARRRRVRFAVHAAAALLVLVVAASRVYLGVHYPTDVLAGIVVGGAWAGFCAAALETAQRLAATRARRAGATADDVADAMDAATEPPAEAMAEAMARALADARAVAPAAGDGAARQPAATIRSNTRS